MKHSAQNEETRPLHILIPVEMHDRLKEMADARDRSISAETRQAIEARIDEFRLERDVTEKAAA